MNLKSYVNQTSTDFFSGNGGMTQKEKRKNIRDNGGGCSICSSYPVVNVSDSYWLCGSCVLERLEDWGALSEEVINMGREDLIEKVLSRTMA